ncbi:MAG: hypothetical protein ACHQYP_11705 [Nitrospiria bacterium]
MKSLKIVSTVLLVFFSITPVFSGYTASRKGVKTNAVPFPIPHFHQMDYVDLAGGMVMATRDLSNLRADRGLVLWIKNAQRTERTAYDTCQSWVDGSCYSGLIYASLLDLKTNKTLQTVFFDMGNSEGSSSLPFRTQAPSEYYSVRGKANALTEKETVLLDPIQFDSDPTCEEYVFFEAPGGCFCPAAFPYGYDPAADKIFRFKEVGYSIGSEENRGYNVECMEELFFVVNQSPGKKRYEFYSSVGHGSEVFTLHRFEYDHKLRTFYGIDIDVPDDDKHNELYLDKEGNLTPAAHRFLDNVWKEKKPQSQAGNGKS